ncbi:hypothetical protein M422DRAFT_783996 [Sphaerobolus stellatus SS14]|uniref:Uncharacterized protein n=1 Tax=Sphaerobolus stellatus (strain SS14) TaxID=990650 RepID=A0A0C9TKY7_SPHS4|nr:hypothetical protein M422DRAFT_783996 [Sphaerobolus stellatus SS14]
MRLKNDGIDGLGRRILNPTGDNLNDNGVVDIVVDSNTSYGVKVINNSRRDLFLNAFHFDNMDFSIVPFYKPPSKGKPATDPTLLANGGSLAIGYGAGGERPFKFVLRKDVNLEIGFIRLSLTS